MASKTRRPGSKTNQPNTVPRRSLTARVMALPRYGRMVIVFIGVLVMAFALTQLVGEFYLRIFATSVAFSTISWILAGVCIAMYFAGYVYIIGTPGIRPEAGRAQTIYLLVIVVLAIISTIWAFVRAAGALST